MERFYYIVENGGFSRELLDLICDTAEVINNVDALVLRFEEELVDRDIKQVSEQ